MGQKTHPLGFRLGITQEHRSTWYANFNQYANLLEEDDQIRTYLDKLARAASISNIQINHNKFKYIPANSRQKKTSKMIH